MSLFTGKGRVHEYERVHDLSHLENLTMRSLILTGAAMVAAALLTGCGTETGPTAETAPGLTTDSRSATHISDTVPITETDINPCNGETIQLTGIIVFQENHVFVDDVEIHREGTARVLETGVGQTTGASYSFRLILHEGFNTPNLPAPNFVYNFRQAYRVTSSTPGLDYTALAVFHVVGLPSGEFKVTRAVESVECRV